MKILAQIDKQTPLTGENLRCCIMSPENKPIEVSFGQISDLLHAISTIFDNRLEIVNRFVIEDSKVLENLNESQVRDFTTAFEALYVATRDHLSNALNENIKFQFSKEVAPGERYTLEMSGLGKEDNLEDIIFQALDIFDTRMIKVNLRELKHSEVISSLPFEDRLPIQLIFDALFGRADPDHVTTRLVGAKAEAQERERELSTSSTGDPNAA